MVINVFIVYYLHVLFVIVISNLSKLGARSLLYIKNPYSDSISSLIEQIENLTGNKLLFPEILYLNCCVISGLHFEHQFPLYTKKFDMLIPTILEELTQNLIFTCPQETIIADLKWLIFRFYVFKS